MSNKMVLIDISEIRILEEGFLTKLYVRGYISRDDYDRIYDAFFLIPDEAKEEIVKEVLDLEQEDEDDDNDDDLER